MRIIILAFLMLLPCTASLSLGAQKLTTMSGWQPGWPRNEIKPAFHFNRGSLGIVSDKREGQHGWWQRSFDVVGGRHYAFESARKDKAVAVPRHSLPVRILWQDAGGNAVLSDPPAHLAGEKGSLPRAEPDYPADADADVNGWTRVFGVYRAPSKATKAIVELHLRWSPNSSVEWRPATLVETAPPQPRIVRLASVHFTPRGGKTPMDNCRMYEPFIADAASKRADLVVLGETITYVGLGKKFTEVAEPMPGPSTEYFCALAKKHKIHIVVGLVERDGSLLYNVAVLIGPDGRIIGVYRKVCLPRGEVDGGLTPGRSFPVFETKLGKIGMMVCYDGFFPEPARELTKGGAEIIAWPVWGCNPLLAGARACENHVYLVSSTFTDISANWTQTAIYGHDGKTLAKAEKWGSVVIAEIDLSQRHFWRNNLGDFRAENLRSRPVIGGEKK